jgi:hypothetical protein
MFAPSCEKSAPKGALFSSVTELGMSETLFMMDNRILIVALCKNLVRLGFLRVFSLRSQSHIDQLTYRSGPFSAKARWVNIRPRTVREDDESYKTRSDLR